MQKECDLMKTILEQMLYDYHLSAEFKREMLNKGYIQKDVLFLEGILYELDKNIKVESFIMLNELLRKTYYRLLTKINKGHYILSEIINRPDVWKLIPTEKYPEAWFRDDVLIFTTETKCGTFTKNNIPGVFDYKDNKWQ